MPKRTPGRLLDSPPDQEALELAATESEDPGIRRRAKIALLAAQGYTVREISPMVGLSKTASFYQLNIFRQKGLN